MKFGTLQGENLTDMNMVRKSSDEDLPPSNHTRNRKTTARDSRAPQDGGPTHQHPKVAKPPSQRRLSQNIPNQTVWNCHSILEGLHLAVAILVP